MERTRKSTVWVDGTCAGSFDSFYAAHRYELTRLLTPGRHTLVVMTDNTDYVSNGGHMTSPDTQTNWNGILGEIYLESVVDIAVDKMWIYPSRKNRSVDIRMVLSGCNTVSDKAWSDISADVSCRLTRLRMKAGRDFEHFEPLGTQTAETRREWILQGKGQDLPYCIETLEVFPEKRCAIRKDDACTGVGVCYEFEKPVKEWDEYNPYVYELTVKILRGGQLLCGQTSHFGFRDFSHRELGGLTNVTVQATWRLKKQAGAQADGREDAGLCEIVVQSVSCRDVSGRGLFTLGTLRLKVPECEKNAEYILRFTLTADNAEDIVNEYDIFIYEEAVAKVQDAHQSFAAGGAEASCDNVCVTNDNKTALDAWQNGKAVALFVRENSMLPDSTMKGEYCTDFWCYPIFRSISEGAGKPLRPSPRTSNRFRLGQWGY